MRCCICSVEKVAISTRTALERLPKAWKRHEGRAFCRSCWRNRRGAMIAARQSELVVRHRRRLSSFAHESASALARFVDRRRYAGVRFEMKNESPGEMFPWSELRRLLGETLDRLNLSFEVVEDLEGPLDD